MVWRELRIGNLGEHWTLLSPRATLTLFSVLPTCRVHHNMHEIGGRQTVFTRKHFSLHEDLQKVIAFLYYFIRFVFYFKYFESKSRLEKKKNIRDNVFIRPCLIPATSYFDNEWTKDKIKLKLIVFSFDQYKK